MTQYEKNVIPSWSVMMIKIQVCGIIRCDRGCGIFIVSPFFLQLNCSSAHRINLLLEAFYLTTSFLSLPVYLNVKWRKNGSIMASRVNGANLIKNVAHFGDKAALWLLPRVVYVPGWNCGSRQTFAVLKPSVWWSKQGFFSKPHFIPLIRVCALSENTSAPELSLPAETS